MSHRSSPRDFDFLLGEWVIANRWRAPDGAWHEFGSTATVTRHVDGLVLLDEYLMPAFPSRGRVTALNVRAFDPASAEWQLVWLSSYAPADLRPVVGAWISETEGRFFQTLAAEDGQVDVRFIYRRVGEDVHWEQALSRDGRVTWTPDWTMHFVRPATRQPVNGRQIARRRRGSPLEPS